MYSTIISGKAYCLKKRNNTQLQARNTKRNLLVCQLKFLNLNENIGISETNKKLKRGITAKAVILAKRS